MKIGFICAGAQKSGTTTLYNILKQHPSICLPEKKEVYFFNHDRNYKKGLSWYFSKFNCQGSSQLLGDITPDYMLFKECAFRIVQDLGKDVKLIFLLRDPAKRAFSQYQMKVKETSENLSFEKALFLEEKRTSKGYRKKMGFSYFERGLYFQMIKPYFDLFSSKNIKVVLFEEFINNLPDEIFSIEEFLEIPHYDKYDYHININEGYMPKKRWIAYIKRHFVRPINSIYNTIVPKELRKIIKKITFEGKVEKESIDNKIYQYLIEKYLPDIKSLEQLINKDLGIWYNHE